MTAPELLPCPFCDETPHTYSAQHFPALESLGCANESCPIQPSTDYLPWDKALAAWNTRPDLARVTTERDAAEAKVARLVNEPIEAVLAKITMWREYDDTRDWVAPGKTLLAELRAALSAIKEAPDA